MTRFTGNSGRIALLCVAQFVVVLDVTVVTSALPALGHELGFTPPGLPWVMTAYTLCFGGFLIVGGRVADLVGARRGFTIGLAGFTGASLLCALAWSAGSLVAFRAVQGSAAALLSPAALALLTASTPEGAGRRRAVGIWTAAAAGGGVTGWLLGGLLTEYADWRWVFGINVPVGLAVLPLVTVVLPRVPGQRGARLTDPLLPAGLIAVRAVRGANLTAAAVTASTSPAMYLAVLYVQNVLHLPPGRAAVFFPVLNLTVIVGSLLGPRLVGRSARWTAAGGFALIAGGCLVLTILPAAGLPAGRLLTAFALMGVGLGLASTASTAAGTEAAPAAHRGVSAGLLTATAQIGTALGLALVAPLAALGPDVPAGMRWGFAAAGLIAVLGLASSRLLSASTGGRPAPPRRAAAR
jgi:MFS family permease